MKPLTPTPPLLAQRLAPFLPMWYWIHARDCPLLYRAWFARGYWADDSVWLPHKTAKSKNGVADR